MSLLDFFGIRGERLVSPKSSSPFLTFRPQIETLEGRNCPSITAPTGLHLTAISPTQVKLTWNDVPNELGFQIYEWNGTETLPAISVGKNITTFTVNSLAPLHQYYFAVEAFDHTSTAITPWAAVTTLPDPITPPTSVKVGGATLTQLTLTWNLGTDAAGYRIFQAGNSQWNLIGSTGASQTSFTVTGLLPGGTYYFQVQAFNATNSATSATVTGTTLTTPLTAPGNLQIQLVGSNTLQLSWTSSVGETGYYVYRWDGTAPNPTLVATLAVGATSYQDVGLPAVKTFWYYVQAFNAGTTVANTPWVDATTIPSQLHAPSDFAVTEVNDFTASLSWNSSAGAAGYQVLMWNGTSWKVVTTVQQGTDQVKVSGLTINRTYWFVIEAFTSNDEEDIYTAPVFINM